ncbi:MAG TPA: phage holin family protein [Gaiellaceae bacterium]|nr:phage holin family protein [Gaiellaceae bacterium]
MEGIVVRVLIALGATAAALAVASLLLDGFTISGPSFVVAVVVFTLAGLVVEPLVSTLIRRHAAKLSVLASLVVTLVTLLVTDLLSDGIEVEGATAWVLGTVIIWLALLVLMAVSRPFVRRRVERGRR